MELFHGPLWFALFVSPFLIPLFAGSRHVLWHYALAAFAPALFFGALALTLSFGSAFIGFLGFGTAAFLGTMARRASLLARDWGHNRPYSLWIEAFFASLMIGFLRLAGI